MYLANKAQILENLSMSLIKKDLPYPHWEFLDVHSGDRLRIVPERGGLITEWRCKGREILYFDLERFRQQEKSIRGGIPILFPICGNLAGGRLPRAEGDFPLSQHGFARDTAWRINSIKDSNGFVLTMKDDRSTRAVYPYFFLVNMEVRLLENIIDFRIKIVNQSEDQMPFSFGLHPYFNVTDLTKIKIEGLCQTCTNHLTMNEAKTDQQIDSLSEGIDFLTGPSKSVTLLDLLSSKRLQLIYEAPMDLTVVWTDPPRKMVCIEPWTSPREALISGDRELKLAEGEIQNLSCQFVAE